MAYDPNSRQLILFGGNVGTYYRNSLSNETWSWDGKTWSRLTPKDVPSPREGSAFAFDSTSTTLALFGGAGRALPPDNRTWGWTGHNWANVSPKASPPGNAFMTLVFDAATDQSIMFGSLYPVAMQPDDQTWLLKS